MRKHQQKQILEFIKTLYEATAEIKRLLSRKDGNSVMQLLADCQDMAIQIGNYIERIEGEGTKTVSLLEEYCQILYQSSLEINNASFDSKIDKHLQKQLVKIENRIKDELTPNKIEIAFISYKASMSDSVESIYLAAKADPRCDAFFIPIPYYDVNPDNSLGAMHYEGADCYSDSIEITDWRNYDIEARHPDVIFTFNPYDEGNLITRVHPNFFCRKLRECTDLLVYVPYFVVTDDIQEHFCTTAGCIYAHKVVVQSEKIRSIYISVFKKAFGNRFGKPEDKFLALGSPKFDSVLSTKREDCALPYEWSNLINGKKVVLYNTSIGGILNGGEQYLKKLRHVMSVFQKRDDLVLWWRPHPLSETTYAGMRPGLLTEYLTLVEDFKCETENSGKKAKSNFIYDTSPDLHRAIAMSDCYFGDGSSSLVALYAQTGKPMVWQNPKITSSLAADTQQEYLHSDIINFGRQLLAIDEFARLYPELYSDWLPDQNAGQTRFAVVSDLEYGTSIFLNAIYKVDEENGKAEYWMSFPDEDLGLPGRYHAPIRAGDLLLFIPASARKWAFYNIKTKEWTYEPVPKELHPSNERAGIFGGMTIYGNDILVMPFTGGAFAKYNIDSGNITYYRDCYSRLKDKVVNPDWGIVTGATHYKDSLLLASPQTNIIFELNPQTMSVIRTHTVISNDCGFRKICSIPNTDTVYLLKFREPGKKEWEESIIKWNIKTGDAVYFTDLPINPIEGNTLNFLSNFIFFQNKLYVIPLQSDTILKIDPQTDEISRHALTPEFDFFMRKSEYYESWAKNQALPNIVFNGKRMKYMVQLPYDNSIADVEFKSGQVSNKRKWYVDGIENLYKLKYRGKTPLTESLFFNLEDYLDQLDTQELAEINKEQISKYFGSTYANGRAGQDIYDYVKKSAGI